MTLNVRSQALKSRASIDLSVREGQKSRMYRARAALEVREGRRLSLDEIGKRVAIAQGRGAAYANSVVRRWIEGMSEPENVIAWQSLAYALGVSPAWLAFGEGPMWGTSGGIAPIESGVDSFTTGEDAAEATAREIAENERAAEEEAQRRRRRASGQGPVDPASGGRARGSARGTPGKRRPDR